MEKRSAGGYIPRFPTSNSEPDSLTARLRDAHANVTAIRHEFLRRKDSASGSLSSLAQELSRRLTQECVPAVRAGRERIEELTAKAPSNESSDELDLLAGKRLWNGERDPLTSAVETTDTAIQLTQDWLRNESGRAAI